MNGVAPGYRRDEGTSRFRRRALSPMPLACCCGTAGRGHESELPSLRHRPHQIVRRVPAMSLLRRGCGIYAESAEPDRAAFRAHQSRVCPGTQQHQGPQQLWPALRTEINLSEAALALSPSMTTPITQRACPGRPHRRWCRKKPISTWAPVSAGSGSASAASIPGERVSCGSKPLTSRACEVYFP